MSRGIKRPRKSTALSNANAAEGPSSSSSSSSTPSVGPREIARKPTTAQQLQQEDAAATAIGMAYSSTPPTKPTKKHSSNSIQTTSSNAASTDDSLFAKSKTAIKPQPAAPVKSALAASARLAAGPPASSDNGSITDARYKRKMYIAFVDNAFAERERGSSKSYWDLVSQFRSSSLASNGPSGVQSLSLWLFALSHHVSKLDSASHSQLVDNILDLPWAGAGEEFSRSWCRFVCALVSARVEWASSVLDRIVKAFRWKSNWLPLQPLNANAPSSSTSPPSSPASTRAQEQPTRRLLYTRCHLLLRALLTLVPTLPSSLNPLLVKHFPHKREAKREQSTYARNILFITQYESQVAETVWRVVVDRAIGLDVEIQIELDEDEDDEDEDDGSAIDPFDLVIDDEEESDDDEDDDGGDGGIDDISDDEAGGNSDEEADNAASAAQAEQRERKVREMVGKLDGLLKVCFDHLDHIGKGKGRQSDELVLDARPSWLAEFLGTGGGRAGSRGNSGGSATPTLERSQSSSTLRVKEEDGANSDDSSSSSARLPPPSGITKTRSPPPLLNESDDEALQGARDSLFRQLLNLFSRSILPTFKCRHVQFLLFWFCSIDNDFADYFLGFLIHKAIYAGSANEDGGVQVNDLRGDGDNASSGRARGEPIVLRQAAASYVASFVSRAKYISPSYTRTVVFNLCSYLEAHLEAYSNAVAFVNSMTGLKGVDEKTQRLALAPPGSEEHAIFYAVAQAVFYIFCFRWQDLQNTTAPLNGMDVLNGTAGNKGKKASGGEIEDHEHDSGFIIGSLSSTGSSSYALPSSFHRVAAGSDDGLDDDDAQEVRAGSNPAINVEFPQADDGRSAASNADWSPGLSVLQRAILSSLNPLQFCSPTVVRQFATVAQHVGFLYCWSVIESNRRGGGGGSGAAGPGTGKAHSSNGPSKGVSGQGAALTKDLEGFFPFDPYRLNSTSDQFIRPMYREWHEVAPAGMMDDESDDDDDDDSSSGSSSDADDDDDALSMSGSETGDTSHSTKITGGLEIPGAGKGGRRHHHHRARQDADADSSALLSPPVRPGEDAAFAKSLEAMSMSAG